MRNRAKCKLCDSIIESLQEKDNCECRCGEISVMGGSKMGCSAKNWNNFFRVDDNDNVIVPTIKERPPAPTRDDLINVLDEMIKRIEGMPQQAMVVSINHYDFVSLLMLLSSIFKLEADSALS
jgi:hypothetical protein